MLSHAHLTLSHPFPRHLQKLSVNSDPFPTPTLRNFENLLDPFPPFPGTTLILTLSHPFPPFPKARKGSNRENAHDPFPLPPPLRREVGKGWGGFGR